MKNIKELILTNFQQWKTGKISFTKGLNILVGNTESGKSTLFRAINSILTGKMPEDYIRKGTKGCEVKINFEDSTYFRRLRSKKENIADADGLIFERVGKDIPFEYFRKLGNTGIEFGNKELSLCSYNQFEPHFFITLSDYDKSKLIGTICGIDTVDKLVDSINKDIRSNNSNIKFLEQQIEEQKTEKEVKDKEFEILDKKTKELSNVLNSIQNNFKTLNNLLNLKDKSILIQNNINTYQSRKNALKLKIDEFNNIKTKELQNLFNLKINLNNINKQILDINNKKLVLSNIKFDSDKVAFLDDLIFLKEKLKNYADKITEFTNNKNNIESKLKELQKQQKELLKDFDKCPLCGGIINEK